MSRMGLSVSIEGGVAIIVYDQVNSPVNTLNSRLGPEFEQLFSRIASDHTITSAVLLSGKTDSWIAGADIDELASATTPLQAEQLSRTGQQLLDKLAAMQKPIVAAIHGAALGGGLEVALACHYRIATEHPKTVFALPEVQLGLIPGAGGTQRLPRKIGLQGALDMILTGKNVRAKKALRLGLVEELVHPSILREVAMRRARELARGETPQVRASRRTLGSKLLDDNAAGRVVVFNQARKSVMKKTHGNLPAPLAALDVVKKGYSDGFQRGLVEEARRFGELAVSEESRQLVYLFFATTALKKDSGLPNGVTATARPVRKIGVLGAGFMGAGIASVAVQQGTIVRMKDSSLDRVAKGFGAVRKVLEERRKRGSITRIEFENMMSLLGGTIDYLGFANVDLVIEAVFEDLEVKHQVLREVEAVAPHAIFATNTSTIPIRDIARASKNPAQVIGMHFFSPVHRMPLLEVIVAPETSDDTTATALAYGRQLGKTVIVVRDGPGFYVNRILAPYLNEAGRLLDQGASIEQVDRALVKFGFPVGPFTLLDEVGLDIAGKSGRILVERFGDRMQPSVTLQRVIESGRTGRKAGGGFYHYDENGKRRGVDDAIYDFAPYNGERQELEDAEIWMRTVLPMLNEAVACFEEGIIRSPRDGDIGAVFGIGFPPFRGGPFRYIDRVGAAEVVKQLDALAARFPGRFTVTSRLRAMADANERFHADVPDTMEDVP